jgi:hypothetical protein
MAAVSSGDRSVSLTRVLSACRIAFGALRPSVARLIAADHPALTAWDRICRKHLTEYRMRHVQDMLAREKGEISGLERQVLESLAREETISLNVHQAWEDARTLGDPPSARKGRSPDQPAEEAAMMPSASATPSKCGIHYLI